jgi:lipid A 3-O-deacylase
MQPLRVRADRASVRADLPSSWLDPEAMPNRLHRPRIDRLPGQWLALALGLHAPAYATEPAGDSQRTLAISVIAHDRGPAGDHHEDGIDLNLLEVLFAPVGLAGTLRPHLGVTLNFVGDTSMAYAGLSFRVRETRQWFAHLLLSMAAHDGPLHKDPLGCRLYSGFGVRVMPRFGFGLEIGYRLNPGKSVTLLVDHMSHKWIIGGENEGIDHIGVRYSRAW